MPMPVTAWWRSWMDPIFFSLAEVRTSPTHVEPKLQHSFSSGSSLLLLYRKELGLLLLPQRFQVLFRCYNDGCSFRSLSWIWRLPPELRELS